jgi:hypothetical protein
VLVPFFAFGFFVAIVIVLCPLKTVGRELAFLHNIRSAARGSRPM